MILSINDVEKIQGLLKTGHIGVMPTDTIYGLHCLANSQSSIDKIYEIKERPKDMPYITLIDSVVSLKDFDIKPTPFQADIISRYWPGANTLIFEDVNGSTRSFRLPAYEFLIKILSSTGPLISTSVNKHGSSNATTIEEAYSNFKNVVDFFVDAGPLNNAPSRVYNLVNDTLVQLR